MADKYGPIGDEIHAAGFALTAWAVEGDNTRVAVWGKTNRFGAVTRLDTATPVFIPDGAVQLSTTDQRAILHTVLTHLDNPVSQTKP